MEQFVHSGGRCTKLRKAAMACKVFDPFVIKTMELNALELLIDGLKNFEKAKGVPLFDENFLCQMKRELPRARSEGV